VERRGGRKVNSIDSAIVVALLHTPHEVNFTFGLEVVANANWNSKQASADLGVQYSRGAQKVHASEYQE
jgi:hypothetical protein